MRGLYVGVGAHSFRVHGFLISPADFRNCAAFC
jgi:hypothetical protein